MERPPELFASGEPRWLGVQFQRAGEVEQPRVLLASVPYALKAADADTLGDLPEVFPDLVVRNKDGQVEAVLYHKLVPMLLNEMQKMQAEIAELKALVSRQ